MMLLFMSVPLRISADERPSSLCRLWPDFARPAFQVPGAQSSTAFSGLGRRECRAPLDGEYRFSARRTAAPVPIGSPVEQELGQPIHGQSDAFRTLRVAK